MTDTYAPLHDRLMAQAHRMLAEIERAKPSTTQEVVAVLRALCVATRLIRQLHTPLTKAKASHPPLQSGGGGGLVPTEGAKPSVSPPPSRTVAATPPPYAALQGRMNEAERPVEEAVVPQTPPASDSANWQKGWSDKQAKLREQRAARTGKWPDGTPYRKTG